MPMSCSDICGEVSEALCLECKRKEECHGDESWIDFDHEYLSDCLRAWVTGLREAGCEITGPWEEEDA